MSQSTASYHDISQILTSSVQEQRSLTPQEESLTREYYLQIVDDTDTSIEQKRDQLLHELGQDLGQSLGYTQHEEQDITIVHHPWNKGSTPTTEKIEYSSIYIIGRLNNCDIHALDNHVSRYHAVIFMYKEAMVILDSWSMAGTYCTDMNKALTIKTVHNKRKVIIFPTGTPLHLRLGKYGLVINPQPCMRCHTNYRYYCLPKVHCEYNDYYDNTFLEQDTVSCHHAIFCTNCYSIVEDYYRSIPNDIEIPAHQPQTLDEWQYIGWDKYSYTLYIKDQEMTEILKCNLCQK